MNGNECLNIAGKLSVRKYTLDGEFVEERVVHNDITKAGRDLVARLFNPKYEGGNIDRVTKIFVGRSKADFDPDAPGLNEEIGSVDIESVTPVSTKDTSGRERVTLQIIGELTEGDFNGEALREAGLFTADGIMYNRVTFETITKSDQFKLTLFWEITF